MGAFPHASEKFRAALGQALSEVTTMAIDSVKYGGCDGCQLLPLNIRKLVSKDVQDGLIEARCLSFRPFNQPEG